MMKDYTKDLPQHIEKIIGENDLCLEIYEGTVKGQKTDERPPLLFVHGAFTGSWMWSKYIEHFIQKGWRCYVINLRSHYKSRVMDMSIVTFEDYLEDIKEAIKECGKSPIVIGFSLGGILCQKLAETEKLAGLVLIDSSVSKQVIEIVPYESPSEETYGIIVPAPIRDEIISIDESENDINFQRKYLSMESSKALNACASWIKGNAGMSVDSSLISCPSLVIRALRNIGDDRRGKTEAEFLKAEYTGFWDTTHTGLLLGKKYVEVVDRVLEWLKNFK